MCGETERRTRRGKWEDSAGRGLALVVKHAHRTVALVVGHPGPVGAVHGDLQVVGSEPVSVRVRVGEETTLHKDTGGLALLRQSSLNLLGNLLQSN